jgi:RNA polymerase sigma-70 factor (ECF subfamily)
MAHSFVSHLGPSGQERRPVRSLADWAPRVYRFALRLTADPHVAEDLTQDTFLRAWPSRGRLRDERALRVWLFRITANLWRDRLRRNRSPIAQASPLAGTETGDEPNTERIAAARDDVRIALDALNALPPRQREVLYLCACEELSSAEIADVLKMSREAVKVNLSLARKRMRELVNDENPVANL